MPAYSPRIVSSLPAEGTTIDRLATLRVTFDVDVAGVSTSSFGVIVRSTQELLDGVVDYTPGTKTATWSTPSGMPASQELAMVFSQEIFDPLTSNALMQPPIAFATREDTTRPEVDLVMPANNATGVAVNPVIVVRFSEHVTGVTSASFNVSALPGSGFYDPADRTVTYTLRDQLAPITAYTVTATAGISDTSGNSLVPFTSTFTTGADTILPALRASVPLPDATNVAVGANVVVTFDEPVLNVSTATFQLNNGAIAGAVTMSNDDKTATFDPTADLSAASTITVTLASAITDTSGNPLAMTTFSFATP